MDIRYNGRIFIGVSDENYSEMKIPEAVYVEAVVNQKWDDIRSQRDTLLRASDYAVMPDYPLEAAQLEEVKAYRQALRDIPETAADPDAVDWPTKPEFLTQ